MPKVGKEVITPDGNGTVVDLNVLKETVRVRIPKGDSFEQKDYPMEDVQRIQPVKSPREERKPKEKPVQAAPVKNNEEISVPDLSVAKDILADRFGISRTLLRTKDAIIEHAAAHGVVFTGI
jgi:hypothetical protein